MSNVTVTHNITPQMARRAFSVGLKTTTVRFLELASGVTPWAYGDLRKSGKTKFLSDLSSLVIWDVDYAEKVYFHNEKNKHTEKWAEKTYNVHDRRLMQIYVVSVKRDLNL